VQSLAIISAFLLTALLFGNPRFLVKIGRILRKTNDSDSYPRLVLRRSEVFFWFGSYLVAWIIGGVGFHFTIRAFVGYDAIVLVDAVQVATVSTLSVLLSSFIPVSVGIQELTSTALLSYWLPVSASLVIAIIYRFLQTFDELIWILIAYSLRKFMFIKHLYN
jgi:hypothetical protein